MRNILPVLLLLSFHSLVAQVVIQSHSVTPSLLFVDRDIPGVGVYPLISSDDVLPLSPGFRFGGTADGSGTFRRSNGEFVILTNHEENFAISRVTLDSSFRPIRGEYLANSDGGRYRLCSASLATVAEHGFFCYLTGAESGVNARLQRFDPEAVVMYTGADTSTFATGLGRWKAENAVPLHKDAYPGKTVVIISDDDSSPNGGQLALYMCNTVGDLQNGDLYVLRRSDGDQVEVNMTLGNLYPVVFMQVENHRQMTGEQINAFVDTSLQAMRFGRVEDVDYRKGGGNAGREIYFTSTGQQHPERTQFGRVYRLRLSATSPLSGTLEVVLDGDLTLGNPAPLAATFMSPDNVCATEDFVYVQEDPNGFTAVRGHDARIYQYSIQTGELKILCEFNHKRGGAANPDSAYYNPDGAGGYASSNIGSWEYGAMVDISDQVQVPNTFTLCLQPHSWRGAAYTNPDGGSLRPAENQASVMVVLTNVPRSLGNTSAEAENGLQARIWQHGNTLTVDLPENSCGTLRVVNGIGAMVACQFLCGTKPLQMDHLPPGFYLASVETGGYIIVKKLLKN